MARSVHRPLELPSKRSSFSLLGLADETLSFLSQKVVGALTWHKYSATLAESGVISYGPGYAALYLCRVADIPSIGLYRILRKDICVS